ncbi:MAG: hypothetical protein V4508_02870 [Pseudomonadota bacterium]
MFSHLRCAMALALLSGCSLGLAPPVAQVHHVPPVSVAQADSALEEVHRKRALIEAQFLSAEQLCYTRFFVNNCLDGAKEKRRGALATLRVIEVDAERYKRQAAVDERDRAVAAAEKEAAEHDAELAAQPPKPVRDVAPVPPPRPPVLTDRVGAHAEKLRKIEARDKADASKRAARVAAFEKNKAESEQRQREVAEKKAAKAAKAASTQ